jgi:rfaE bifunctional protein nucleotidyltransferase chain/domain/rfaE bifunctional protein kinase chain/domain
MTPLVVVGDSLLDRDLVGCAQRLAPDAPVPVVDQPEEFRRPGGAALAAAMAAGDGRPTTFVTALGDDAAGHAVAGLLDHAGVQVIDVGLTGATPQKVRVRAAAHPLVRLDYGGLDTTVGVPGAEAIDALRGARAILVSDYGRGLTAQPALRSAIAHAADRGAKVTWDPHPRGASPTHPTRVVTPNLAEAQQATGTGSDTVRAVTEMALTLCDRWDSAGVAVTLGARGALLVGRDGTPLMVPAPHAAGALDPCGAGDRFAVSVTSAMADGAVLSEAVVKAVAAATAFIAGGGVGALAGAASPDNLAVHDTVCADDLIRTVHARGGTVVATGGCFDLLHAGHVQLLQAARGLGDCLIVCINSDASVARLKGPGRPLVAQDDRRAVLKSLAAVDDVVVFDEDTPEDVLARLQPDVWVKGADYAVADLPEAQLLASWGGQAVVLPYLDGRSTTAMIQEAVRHASH